MSKDIVQYDSMIPSDWDARFIEDMCELLEIEFNKKKLYHWINNIMIRKIGIHDRRNVFVMMDKNDRNRFVMIDNCPQEQNYIFWVIQINKHEEEKYRPLIAEKLKQFSNWILKEDYGEDPHADGAVPYYTASTWTDKSDEEDNMYKTILKTYEADSVDDFLFI